MGIPYTIYDKVTGAIERTGSCQKSNLTTVKGRMKAGKKLLAGKTGNANYEAVSAKGKLRKMTQAEVTQRKAKRLEIEKEAAVRREKQRK